MNVFFNYEKTTCHYKIEIFLPSRMKGFKIIRVIQIRILVFKYKTIIFKNIIKFIRFLDNHNT